MAGGRVVAASFGVHAMSGRTLLVFVSVLLLLASLVVACLIELVRAPEVRYLPSGCGR